MEIHRSIRLNNRHWTRSDDSRASDQRDIDRPKGGESPLSEAELGTDAVVQRRIEHQIRRTLGDKVQSVQMRVSGRNVLIVARASRLWKKRGVQRSLESLPALNGYRARVELDD